MKISRKVSVFLIIILFTFLIPSYALAEEGETAEVLFPFSDNTSDAETSALTDAIEKITEVSSEETPEETILPEIILPEESDPPAPEIPEKTQDETDAEKFIDLVFSIGSIGPEDEMMIYDALGFYDSLSTLSKEMVKEAKMRLDDAVSILSYLKTEGEKITKVIEDIKYIKEITKEDGHIILSEKISALEESYETLDDLEKLVLDETLIGESMEIYGEFIINARETLALWEREYNEHILLPVTEKIEFISQIPFDEGWEVLSEELTALEGMYSVLDDPQKMLLDELTGGYAEIHSILTDRLEAWQNAEDINKVISMLEEIASAEKITTAHEELIGDTSLAIEYSDRSMIPEDLLTELEIAKDLLAKEKEYERAAREVAAVIENIGEVTLGSESLIKNAREAYEKLTEDEKYYVGNLFVLTSAEERYSYLILSKKKAEETDILISSIGPVSLEREEYILYVRGEYDLLDDTAKGFVENNDILVSAENVLSDIKAAKEVDDMILSVGEADITKKELIYLIRDKYDALTDEQKLLVENYDMLVSAEDILRDHIAARKVTKLIDKLPENATFTKDVSIHSAKAEYDKLTEFQKSLVENSSKLIRLHGEMVKMEKYLEEYLAEYSEDTLYIEDTTGYVSITASAEDLLTDKDKDLICRGKVIVYTVTVMAEEFEYDEVNLNFLPVEYEEVPFSPFYYIFISRSVASITSDGVISEESESYIKEIPGEMIVEITLCEDMMPEVTDITRIFTGLISKPGDMENFSRIIDIDPNMNTITFTVNGSVSIIPSFIDIMNPMTGDDGNIRVYLIFTFSAVMSAAVILIRRKVSVK